MGYKHHREHLVPVSAKIPAEVAAELEGLAAEGDRSVSRQIRRAVEDHIESSGSRLVRSSPVEAGGRRASASTAQKGEGT